MVPITATVEVTDICDPAPTWAIVDATSDEPDNGRGDGNTTDDIQGIDFFTPDTEFSLRSERQGMGDGRKYTIVFAAVDCSNNPTVVEACVYVPHDQSGNALAIAGYLENGTALDYAHNYFSVGVLSKPALLVTEIDAENVLLGNGVGVIKPLSHRLHDLDGDGTNDIIWSFDTQAFQQLRQDTRTFVEYDTDGSGLFASPNGPSSPSTAEAPLGLHYRIAGEGDPETFLVADVMALGRPWRGDGDNGEDVELDRPQDETSEIAFRMPESGTVRVEVFDVQGRKLQTLANESFSAGQHVGFTWDRRDTAGRQVSNGVYFYRVVGPKVSSVKKIVVMQ
jgi:hypothetical protein